MEYAHDAMTKNYLPRDTLSELTDAELLREAQTTGSHAALVALYRRYLPRVYRYFYARVGNVQVAEDLTSQTCVAVLESLPRYRERGAFAAWVFTIAARRYADYCRTRTLLALESVPDGALPADAAPLPDDVIVHSEQMSRLASALRALSPDRAQAVALHFFGGLSHKETAQAMQRSRIAVKSLIHRALRDLRERLSDEEI